MRLIGFSRALIVTVLVATSAAAATAYPGTFYVTSSGSKSSRSSSEAYMLARESAVANAERTCSVYANTYQGEDWRLVEVRTTNSSGNWIGDWYFANVNISAKCIVTRS
jgi:hypothetical protein